MSSTPSLWITSAMVPSIWHILHSALDSRHSALLSRLLLLGSPILALGSLSFCFQIVAHFGFRLVALSAFVIYFLSFLTQTFIFSNLHANFTKKFHKHSRKPSHKLFANLLANLQTCLMQTSTEQVYIFPFFVRSHHQQCPSSTTNSMLT